MHRRRVAFLLNVVAPTTLPTAADSAPFLSTTATAELSLYSSCAWPTVSAAPAPATPLWRCAERRFLSSADVWPRSVRAMSFVAVVAAACPFTAENLFTASPPACFAADFAACLPTVDLSSQLAPPAGVVHAAVPSLPDFFFLPALPPSRRRRRSSLEVVPPETAGCCCWWWWWC